MEPWHCFEFLNCDLGVCRWGVGGVLKENGKTQGLNCDHNSDILSETRGRKSPPPRHSTFCPPPTFLSSAQRNRETPPADHKSGAVP